VNQRDKAAYIVGIVDAFRIHGWPAEFSPADKADFMRARKHAGEMLGDGVFNPIHGYIVLGLANRLLGLANGKSDSVAVGG